MDARRTERVAEALREELAEIIAYEMSDPRLAAVAVTGVAVSRDLRQARVWIRSGGDTQRRQVALKALEGARHWIRRQVAARLRLWRIPEFHFQDDGATEAWSGGQEPRRPEGDAEP